MSSRITPGHIEIPIHLAKLLAAETKDFSKHADVTAIRAMSRAMLRLIIVLHTASEKKKASE